MGVGCDGMGGTGMGWVVKLYFIYQKTWAELVLNISIGISWLNLNSL